MITIENQLVWRKAKDLDESVPRPDDIPFNTQLREIQQLSAVYSLCITGTALTTMTTMMTSSDEKSKIQILQTICPYIAVYARVSPIQKEIILRALNDNNLYTLMCGDGTNDVGALKTAHVGVSIVNDPEFENRIDKHTHKMKKDGSNNSAMGGSTSSTNKDRLNRALLELQEQEQDPTIVKLGDASIASPFTSRRTSIDAVMTVLRQGRATLVTTVEIYKILGQ